MSAFDVEPEYIELVQPDTLDPVVRLEQPALLAIAARIGATRLIDNVILSSNSQPMRQPTTQPNFNSTFPPTQFELPANPLQAKPREAQATCSA